MAQWITTRVDAETARKLRVIAAGSDVRQWQVLARLVAVEYDRVVPNARFGDAPTPVKQNVVQQNVVAARVVNGFDVVVAAAASDE